MALNPKTEQVGTAGGTAINVDMSRIESSAPVRVLTSASYTTTRNPGDPSRPSMTGAAFASLDYPRTVASSTVLSLLSAEAAALVTAGKASYD